MVSNANALVRQGISAYRAGNHAEARELLFHATELDKNNEQAWLWLSAVVDTVEDQQTCLENVLTINPNNEKARQGLTMLQGRAGNSPAVTSDAASDVQPSALVDDPFGEVNFTAAAPIEQPMPPSRTDDDLDTELPDTDWEMFPTSSASARQPAGADVSHADYDDWVAGLNLGSSSASDVFGEAEYSQTESVSSLPFVDTDNLFGDDPFGVDEDDDIAFDLSPAPADDPLDVDRAFLLDDEDDAEGFSASPFLVDIEEEDDAFPPATSGVSLHAQPSRTSPPVISPSSFEEDDTADDLLASLENESVLLDASFEDPDFNPADPVELFRFIPDEIKATRIPGTRERYPVMLILGLVLFSLLNVGMLAWVYITLTTA